MTGPGGAEWHSPIQSTPSTWIFFLFFSLMELIVKKRLINIIIENINAKKNIIENIITNC